MSIRKNRGKRKPGRGEGVREEREVRSAEFTRGGKLRLKQELEV